MIGTEIQMFKNKYIRKYAGEVQKKLRIIKNDKKERGLKKDNYLICVRTNTFFTNYLEELQRLKSVFTPLG